MIIAGDYGDLSFRTAKKTADFINSNPGVLLCLAAGDTPLGAYSELVRMQTEGAVDLSSVYYAGLDEWIGLGPADKGSCHQVMYGSFYEPAEIPSDRINVFDGLADPAEQCIKMNDWIRLHDGIGLTILGIGMNGHIGFNEPGVLESRGAIIVPLDNVTIGVSVKYFGKEIKVSHGLTIGLTELSMARKVLVIAGGGHKAGIIKQAFCEPASASVPASLLQDHPDITLMLDEDAAKDI